MAERLLLLPLPLGEVAERSEDGEGKKIKFLFTNSALYAILDLS